MTKNNLKKTFLKPEPYKFEFEDKMSELYKTEKNISSIRIVEKDLNMSNSEGVKGDIIYGSTIKSKEVLAVHDGIEWKYCYLYSSDKLVELNNKVKKLEMKILKLENN